jgi:hypothetical protein
MQPAVTPEHRYRWRPIEGGRWRPIHGLYLVDASGSAPTILARLEVAT